MSEEKKFGPIYIFEDSCHYSPYTPVEPGTILFLPPEIRIIELHPDRPARVISFDGIIEDPDAEANVESAKKWMLTDEGLKAV